MPLFKKSMNPNTTWFKHYRKIREWKYRSNPKVYSVWMALLERATFQEKFISIHDTTISLKAGQCVIGRFALSEETGIHPSSIVRILKTLEIEHQIEQQKTNKYTIISILNWEQYQSSEHQIEQQVNNSRTTDEQQVNTNKKEKEGEEREEGERSLFAETPKLKNPTITDCLNSLPILHFQSQISIDAMTLWFESRKQKRKPITPLVLKVLIDRIKNWTPERFMAAVQYSIEYIKLIEPPLNNKRAISNEEMIEALNMKPEDFNDQ